MREMVQIIGLSTMLAMTIVVFITFMAAYMSPTKSVHVLVNELGEADIEFVLMSVLLVLNTFVTLVLSGNLYADFNERKILQKVRFLKRNKKYLRDVYRKAWDIWIVRN